MAQAGRFLPVMDGACTAGVLHQRPKVWRLQCGEKCLMGVWDADLPAHGGGAGAQHFQRLRVNVRMHHEHGALAAGAALGQSHGFGCGGGFVQHGRIGNGHGSEVTHHGLKVQQGFQTALRNFCLIRGVGRVPGRILQNVALNDAWRVRAVIALADKALEDAVATGNGFEFLQRFGLSGSWRQVHGVLQGDAGGDDGLHQRVA